MRERTDCCRQVIDVFSMYKGMSEEREWKVEEGWRRREERLGFDWHSGKWGLTWKRAAVNVQLVVSDHRKRSGVHETSLMVWRFCVCIHNTMITAATLVGSYSVFHFMFGVRDLQNLFSLLTFNLHLQTIYPSLPSLHNILPHTSSCCLYHQIYWLLSYLNEHLFVDHSSTGVMLPDSFQPKLGKNKQVSNLSNKGRVVITAYD